MRLFTFGCSLTQFFYPTWADLLIAHYHDRADVLENWGKSGAGNQYIFTRIWEADSIYHFNEDDIIVVQWTAMYRDDRWIEKNGWHCAGNLYHGQLSDKPMNLNNYNYTSQWQWADPIHCVMRDCAMISSIKAMLEQRGCKTVYFSFNDFYNKKASRDAVLDQTKSLDDTCINGILNQYKEYINTDALPIMEWNGLTDEHFEAYSKTRPLTVANPGDTVDEIRPELHPLPFEHARYLEEQILPLLGEQELNSTAVELAEIFQTRIEQASPAVLALLGWTDMNTDKIGWSDD